MSCREFAELFLDALLARELPARRHVEAERHLATCAACSHYAAAYRAVVQAVGALRDTEPPPADESLVQAILRRAGLD